MNFRNKRSIKKKKTHVPDFMESQHLIWNFSKIAFPRPNSLLGVIILGF